MNSRGFTIVELVVVIVVVGVLAATAIPRFFNRSDYDLRGFHDKVLSTLQLARKTAIAARHHVCVTVNSSAVPPYLALNISSLDPDSNSFDCSLDLSLPSQDSNCPSGINNRTCAPSGLVVSQSSLGVNGTVIVFTPSGRPTSSGTLTITSSSAGSSSVTLEAETGYAH